MDAVEFERYVEQALTSLPPQLAEALTNVTVVVEEQNADDPDLFGLYLGVPLTERGERYVGALPDQIAIYRRPLEAEFGHDSALLAEEIRITVLHELAHHFGIEDDRLDELGY